jgi:hypothetical protein
MNRQYGHQSTSVEITTDAGKSLLFSEVNDVETVHDFKESENSISYVKVNGGYTKNLGNFESLRVDVSLELPCKASEKGIAKAFKYASDWVPAKLAELTDAALGSVNGDPDMKGGN